MYRYLGSNFYWCTNYVYLLCNMAKKKKYLKLTDVKLIWLNL